MSMSPLAAVPSRTTEFSSKPWNRPSSLSSQPQQGYFQDLKEFEPDNPQPSRPSYQYNNNNFDSLSTDVSYSNPSSFRSGESIMPNHPSTFNKSPFSAAQYPSNEPLFSPSPIKTSGKGSFFSGLGSAVNKRAEGSNNGYMHGSSSSRQDFQQSQSFDSFEPTPVQDDYLYNDDTVDRRHGFDYSSEYVIFSPFKATVSHLCHCIGAKWEKLHIILPNPIRRY
jgi:hypothetical protein